MGFTKETLDSLTLPEGKTDVIHFDDKLPGFGIRLRAGGARSWVIQYRAGHRQRRETLGDVRKVRFEDARKIARKRFAQVVLGTDPASEKTQERTRAKLTLGAIADRYLEFKRPKLRVSSYKASSRYLTRHWKPLRNLPVHAVERRDVAAQLGEIAKKHGIIAASRARATLSAFFAWAIREGVADQNPVVGTNEPAAGIRSRDRVLAEAEIRTVWNACQGDDFGRIIRLLFLTGARRDEVGGLCRHEIDMASGILHIPGTRTKNHRDLVLTLPPVALDIIKSAARREGRDFVFGSRGGAFCAWSYSMLALNKRIAESGAQLAPWRIHDIRRSAATHMAELGIQPHIVEAALNHVSGHKAGVAGIYNRAGYEREVKAALALWADHVRSIVEGSERKVLPLGSAEWVPIKSLRRNPLLSLVNPSTIKGLSPRNSNA